MLNFLKKIFNLMPKIQDKTDILEPQHNVNPAPKYKKPKAPKSLPLKEERGLMPVENIPKMPKVKKVKKEETAPKKRGRPPKNKP